MAEIPPVDVAVHSAFISGEPIKWPERPWYTELMHYIAGGAVLAMSLYATKEGLMDKSMFTTLMFGAAIAVGIKVGGKL